MGLKSFLIEEFGPGIAWRTLEEKCPPLAVFIDSLDECSLPEAMARAIRKQREITVKTVLKVSLEEVKLKTVDWEPFFVRMLTEKPFIKVLYDFFKQIGIEELSGVNLEKFINKVITYEEK